MGKGNRILWIDYIKGICMFLVVMSHIPWPEEYRLFFSPIFLTGFFFASGYTFKNGQKFREFLLARARTLIIPIITLGCINAILAYMADGKPMWDRLCGLVMQRAGQWDDLWFVACLFTLEILYYCVSKMTKSLAVRFVLCFIMSILGYVYISQYHNIPLVWHFDNACVLIPFFCVGNLLHQSSYLNVLVKYINSNRGYLLALLVWILYAITVVIGNNVSVDIHLREYGNYPIFMLNAIIGVVALFVSVVKLEQLAVGVVSKTLSFIGQNTLVYYAFQFKVIRLVQIIFSKVQISTFSYVGNIVSSVLVCLLLAFPACVVKRYFPWCLGRWYK